jgi:hypothetical protein
MPVDIFTQVLLGLAVALMGGVGSLMFSIKQELKLLRLEAVHRLERLSDKDSRIMDELDEIRGEISDLKSRRHD